MHVLKRRHSVLLDKLIIKIIKQIPERVAACAAALHLLLNQRNEGFQVFMNLKYTVLCEKEKIRGFDHLCRNIKSQSSAAAAVLVGNPRRDESNLPRSQLVFPAGKTHIKGLGQDNDDMPVAVAVIFKSFLRIVGIAGYKSHGWWFLSGVCFPLESACLKVSTI